MDTKKAPGSAGTLTRATETAGSAISCTYSTTESAACQAAFRALEAARFELKRAVALLKLAGWEARTDAG